MKQQFNLYYGTVGGPLEIKYRGTRMFNDEKSAIASAFEEATNLYYKNEGKHGLPGYKVIQEESDITGINILKLYEEHVKDLMRWYAVPTVLDMIGNKHLIFI